MTELFYELHVFFAFIISAFTKLTIQVVKVFLQLRDMCESSFSLFQYGSFVAQHHNLWQITDGYVFLSCHFTTGRLLQSCYYLQHSGLSGTVFSYQCYAVFRVDYKAYIRKQRFSSKFYF